MPNLSAPFWWSSAQVPRLISSPRLLRRYVPFGDTVLVLPYDNLGDGTFLQAEAHFDFQLADGYLAPVVPSPWSQLQLAYLLSLGITPTDGYAVDQFRRLIEMGCVSEGMVNLPVTPGE